MFVKIKILPRIKSQMLVNVDAIITVKVHLRWRFRNLYRRV